MYRIIVVMACFALVVLGVAVVSLAGPADAQDRTEERLTALETRVAELTERVATLEAERLASPVASEPDPAASYTITGDLLLRQPLPGMLSDIAPCVGINGYDDIHGGASVVVRDSANAVIATGSLGDGEWVEEPNASEIAELDWNCRFPIMVENVPRSAFYSIEVGHRGGLTYPFDEMVAADWKVHLILGSND